MREALNENPIAQVGIVLVLAAVAAFMLLKPGGGGGEEEESASGPTVATVNGVTATGDSAGEAVESAVEGAIASGAVGAAGGETGAMPTSVPAPPPPRQFSAAYDANKTVVLLVVHDGGIDDRLTASAATVLVAEPQVKLIPVPMKQLPRYASVTVGLDLNRVPALVVMKPKRLSGGVPQATVDYGFQTPESILLAVNDAEYQGPEVTYHPE